MSISTRTNPVRLAILAASVALAVVPVAASAANYADVVRVTEVGDDCRYDDRYDDRRGERDSDTDGKIIGAIVGGLAGNQIGSGSGRAVATVGGAVAGAAIGGKVDRNNDRDRDDRYRDDRRCDDTAFRVDYRWDGDIRSTRLAYDPGRSVRVNRYGDVIRR